MRNLAWPFLRQHDRMSGQLHRFLSPETDRGWRKKHELQGKTYATLVRLRLRRVGKEGMQEFHEKSHQILTKLLSGVVDKLQVLV